MRKYTLFCALLALIATFSSCRKEPKQIVNTPAFDSSTLTPKTDESGTVRAFVGTEVSAKGFNLDQVTKVIFSDVEAEIISQKINEIKFVVPQLELAQQDDPHHVILKAYGVDAENHVFKTNYYVTVPVTDALVSGYEPATGTIGTKVTIKGRNLEQVTSVKFGSASVSSEAFVSQDGAQIVVAVPPMAWSSANEELAIKAYWGSDREIDVTGESVFILLTPAFDAVSQSAPALLGDEVTLTGTNLDLVKSVSWGSIDLPILEAGATGIKIFVPSSIEQTTPAVKSDKLCAVFGTPDQKVTVSEGFSIDTTPVGPSAPEISSVKPSDEKYTKFYLTQEVTIKGQNMASVEKVMLGETEAALVGAATDTEARFVIPSNISGTVAVELDLTVIWNGGNHLEAGKVTVHPFYLTKGLKIRTGSNSASTYPEANSQQAFLMLDEGKVISAAEWKSRPVDAPVVNETPIVKEKNKLLAETKKETYYGVSPYLLLTADSSSKLAFQNPANSNGQLKNHRIDGVSLPSLYGSPVIFMSVITNASLKSSITEGSLTDIWENAPKAGAGAPAFGTAETSSVWVKGSVLCIEYLTYTHSIGTGGKVTDLSQVHKIGYMYIKDVTCGNSSTGKAEESREGYVEFDLYWSNTINE